MSQVICLQLTLGVICAPVESYALALGAVTQNFGVCAATTITNAGNTVVIGPIGVSSGTSITGFPPGIATTIELNTVAAPNCEAQAGTPTTPAKGLPPPRTSAAPLLAASTSWLASTILQPQPLSAGRSN